MSLWTHVNAHFRFDLFKVSGFDYDNIEAINDFLSKPKTYSDVVMGDKLYNRVNRDSPCKLPMGSEGSLRHKVYIDNMSSRYVNIAFFGDLRDGPSAERIVDYFEELLNDKNLSISLRSGMVEINEYSEPSLYSVTEEFDETTENTSYKLVKLTC